MVTSPEISRQVALDRIRVPEDVRMLDDAHAQALAGFKRQRIIVPLVSAPTATASIFLPGSIATRRRNR
jgi:hypothetical protein